MVDNLEYQDVSSKLVLGLVEGDVQAFKKVYNYYFNRVFHFVNRFSIRTEDTEEIVQDVFLKLWENRATIDQDKNLSGFLFVIAQNLVIDKIRKHVSESKKIDKVRISYFRKKPENFTEQEVNYDELSGIIDGLVDQLPTKRRTVFKLSREKGFTNKEIADLLKVSQGTIEKQMSKALHTLTANLKSRYGIMVDLMLFVIPFLSGLVFA